MNQSQVTKSKKWPNAEDAQKIYVLTCIIVRIDCINLNVNGITLRPMTETSPLLLIVINGGWKTPAYRHLLKRRVKRLLLVLGYWPRRLWATATFRSSSSTIYPRKPFTTPVLVGNSRTSLFPLEMCTYVYSFPSIIPSFFNLSSLWSVYCLHKRTYSIDSHSDKTLIFQLYVTSHCAMKCLNYCDGFLTLLLKLSVLLLCFYKNCAKFGFGTLLPPIVMELVHPTLDCTTQLFHFHTQ